MVFRVFLDRQTQPSEGALTPEKYRELLEKRGKIIVDRNDCVAGQFVSKEQEGIIFNLIAIRFPEGKDHPYGWSWFNRHFMISSYKNLPASKFAEACCYIPSMPDKKVKALPAPALSTLPPAEVDIASPLPEEIPFAIS
ncbi:hypothetical protein ABO04_08865 [Nitrosomonas sp. HPC101]|uniref:hypothetical protein n=1 Tax=Nitrosomonas sp. HPC101 TaxID=1658667 RepID=UPI001371F51B|nr:hypothetical protein [Nitrosomonas sp. HPC101]MXS86015.1 hypothetical protein [Nitrosomonas sp. HPC101]